MASLECREVTVEAEGGPILDRVSFSVPDGACCVVMGPSGAGKSTLLGAIAGLVVHRGTVTLGGADLAGVALHRRGVGLLFQRARLFPTMSALDNVAYPLRLRGVARRPRREQAAALLDEVGLGPRGNARPHELSGGEGQRVALARALCSDPELLLLDEPLTGLDLPQRRQMVKLLADIRLDRGLTWLVVSHDPGDATALADSVIVLDRGSLIQQGRPAAVRRDPVSPLVAALLEHPGDQ